MKQKLILLMSVMFLLALPMVFSYNFNDGTSSGNISFRDINTIVKYINITTASNITSITIDMTGFMNLTRNKTYPDVGSTDLEDHTFNNSNGILYVVDDIFNNAVSGWSLSGDTYTGLPDLHWNLPFTIDTSDKLAFNNSDLWYYIDSNNTLYKTDLKTTASGGTLAISSAIELEPDVKSITFANGDLWSCQSVLNSYNNLTKYNNGLMFACIDIH